MKTMQTNVAVGYAVCYIFGSLGPIIMVSWFLPLIMKWNIRARKRSSSQSCCPADTPNSTRVSSMPPAQIVTRIYEVARDQQGHRQ